MTDDDHVATGLFALENEGNNVYEPNPRDSDLLELPFVFGRSAFDQGTAAGVRITGVP